MPSTGIRERSVAPMVALLLTFPLLACVGNGGSDFAGGDGITTTADPCSTLSGSPGLHTGNSNTVLNANTSGNGNSTNGNSTPGSTSNSVTGLSVVQVPLLGCFASDYTAAIRLGDGQSYQLIVDTGSTTLAVAATSCTNCSGISPTYTPGTKATDDQYSVSGLYGDGSSWSGVAYTDVVSIGNDNDVSMAFAAIDKQSMSRLSGRNFFNPSYCSGSEVENASQGIIGMGVTALALAHTDAYLDKFESTNSLQDIVAFQFCDLGGNLWIGGTDPNSTSANPNYTPMNTTNGYYEVTMQDMMLDGTPVGSTSDYGAAIVDTGTSVMLVTTTVLDAVNNALDNSATFVSYFGSGFIAEGSCSVPATSVTRDQLDAALPKLTLSFPDAQGNIFQVQMNATDSYLMAMKADTNGTVEYCAAISSGAGSDGIPNVLLGNNVMHSQITIFDRVHSQLGLAPQVGCSRL